jgi:hypothetical protein
MSKFALLFLMIFFGGAVAAFTFSSAAAFGLYQIVYLLNPDDRWWSAGIPGLRYSLIASLIMLTVFFINYRELTEVSPWSRHPSFKWIFIILLIYMAEIFTAIAPDIHKQFLLDFSKLIIIIFVAYKLINTEKKLDAVLWIYCVGCAYIGYLAWTVGRNSQGRVEGIGFADGQDANGVAAVLAPSLVLLLCFFWQGNKKIKIAAAVLGALIANGIVLINSRGSFLAVTASGLIFILFMIFSKYQRSGQRFTAVFVIVFGISGALYVADDLFWERMGTLQDIQKDEGRTSGASRMEFWMATFDMIKDYPQGVGISGFQILSSNYIREDIIGGVDQRAVHSSWFQLLSEVGWLGPIFFAFLLFSLLRQSSNAKSHLISNKEYEPYFKVVSIECAVLAYFVAATFIDRFRAEVFWWVIIFLMMATNIYYLKLKSTISAEPKNKRKIQNGALT